ncbi:MAG: DUF6090 family protein [Pseudomonadota bacterium]|nr:DUF6090 family protein [Pseudomonadota bacterium]
MVRTFRKIRLQALLTKRLKQYIPYAIGEILLVVIGILIALQLNNWNENRKNETKTAKLHEQLYQELTIARNYLVKREEYLSAYASYTESLIRDWQSVTYADALDRIPYDFSRRSFTLQFYFTSFSEFHDPKHDIFDKAINDGGIAGMNAEFVAGLNSVYISSNTRINQLLAEEYRLAQEITMHIATHFAEEFVQANRQDYDWDEATYERLFSAYRQDGSLRGLLDARLQIIKGRIVLTQKAIAVANESLSRFKPRQPAE